MKTVIILFLISIMISSCLNESKNDTIKVKKPIPKVEKKREINEKLLGFKTVNITELGENKYFLLEKKIKNGKIETKYINDIIYVSFYEELNACGRFDGDIKTKDDTIKLQIDLISDELCDSQVIKKITFLIDNPDEKEKVIIKS